MQVYADPTFTSTLDTSTVTSGYVRAVVKANAPSVYSDCAIRA